MSQPFTSVKIRTKPYIKHYLEYNYGSPVKIPKSNFIGKYLTSLLGRPVKFNNTMCKTYPSSVDVSISETIMIRYGYGLTKTNTKEFNVAIENYIRSQIRSMAENIFKNNIACETWKKKYDKLQKEHSRLLNINTSKLTLDTSKEFKIFEKNLRKRMKESLKDKVTLNDALMIAAYDLLGFDEQILPFETIRKDYYRYKIAQNC